LLTGFKDGKLAPIMGESVLDEVKHSAIEFAAQTGRLDLVSLLLTLVSLILVVGGVIAYLNFRSIAKQHAITEATKVAEVTAERATNEYLQKELPDLLEAYRSFLNSEGMSDDEADELGSAQDNEEGVEK
jgi:hypothetical protein